MQYTAQFDPHRRRENAARIEEPVFLTSVER